MSLKPGVYFLQNIKSGTVLDLSGVDGKAVIGHPKHGGKNQKWEFGRLGNRGWFIKNLYTRGSHYLTVEAGPRDNLPVIATEFPVSWEVISAPREGDDIYRICWPNTQFAIDLYKGSPANLTPVNLVIGSRIPQQLWKFTRCSDDKASNTLIREDDAGTTTITTTTTTTTKIVTTKSGGTRVEQ